MSGKTIFLHAFSSWNGALLTPARIGNLAYHNRHPNTYPYLSFDSRYTSTGENGENGGIRMVFEFQLYLSKNYSRQA